MSMAPWAHCCWMAQTVVLDLDVIIVAEELVEPLGDPACLVQAILEDVIAKLGRGTTAETDDAFMAFSQQLFIDSRLVVIAF